MEKRPDQQEKAVADPETYRTALEAWMQLRESGATDLSVTEVDMPRSTGFSNETVFFRAAWQEAGAKVERRYVARIEPEKGALFPRQTPSCEVSVEVQYRIMEYLRRETDVPLPPTVAFEADGSILGRPFFVMEFVDGDIPGDVPLYSQEGFLVDRATPADRRRLIETGIDTMAAIHAVRVSEGDLAWLDASQKGTPQLRDQLALYRASAQEALAGREHPVLLRAFDYLETSAPEATMGLSWGDSRIGNMIWSNYRPAAVVDWEACALCPPEADIGWWIMYDRMAFDDSGTARLEGYPERHEMVERWERTTGRVVSSDIDYWEIFAAMRFDYVMIPLGDRLEAAGIVPGEMRMWVDNGTTQALDRLLQRQSA